MADNVLLPQLVKDEKIGKYWSYCTQRPAIINVLLNFNNKRLYFTGKLLTTTKHKFHHKTEAHGNFYGI